MSTFPHPGPAGQETDPEPPLPPLRPPSPRRGSPRCARRHPQGRRCPRWVRRPGGPHRHPDVHPVRRRAADRATLPRPRNPPRRRRRGARRGAPRRQGGRRPRPRRQRQREGSISSRARQRERLRAPVPTTDPAALAAYAGELRPVVASLRALAEEATARPSDRTDPRAFLRAGLLKSLRTLEARLAAAAPPEHGDPAGCGGSPAH
jgi:hypothetical protein